MKKEIFGVFEPDGKGGGHLRDPESGYRIGRHDVLIPRDLCKKLFLRGGETIVGTVVARNGSKAQSTPILDQTTTINGMSAGEYSETKPFGELTAIHPEEQVKFETPEGPLTTRVVDLLTPIGFGQRGLIVAPPRTGKTILLQQLANGVATNYPDLKLIMLLVDERPEEVTDMRRSIRGEVVASSNDHDVHSHIRLARLTVERAKRLVEGGCDVLVFLDSLTRLGRAFNNAKRGTGRIMSGGLDAGALIEPKGIFGAARNIENGGSLTIIATALIDTGSRMDEVIFNEFKGTGNMEIVLCRELANKRMWPAIELGESGTRREEALLTPAALDAANKIRRVLMDRDPIKSMDNLLGVLNRHPNNDRFVESFAPQPLRRR